MNFQFKAPQESAQDKNKSVKKNNFDDLVNVPGPSDITAYKLDNAFCWF